ncbi:MAG: alpha-galactosidase [Clostridiales bacterium]|nr:alpha-galactosidase [Clostridiales bacterium]
MSKENRKIFWGVAAAAAGAAAITQHVRKRIDLKEIAKKLANTTQVSVPVDEKYQNDLALTPPMGWASWNFMRNRIDEKKILETAEAMRDSGLLAAGYQYLNLDDCWQSSMRDENGRLQADPRTFPSGIKGLREKVNDIGLKLGIYSSNGTFTCEDMPASLGHEAVDADTFAEWGIEYMKYDFCHNKPIPQRAPCIEKITVGRDGGDEITVMADDAILRGMARIVDDKKLSSGRYIAGIDSNLGSAEFYVEVPEAGEYVLTLCVRKKSNSYKYAEILVNGERRYETTLPPTHAFSPDGRHQVKIELDKGANLIKIYNPIASRRDSSAVQYTRMGKELLRATKEYAEKTGEPERQICYSICEWGLSFPWQWGRQAGNLWRTTPDIKPFWASVLGIYEITVMLHKYAGIGGWNDPDMLEVGNGSLTDEENKTHFTLWCMMAAPLILGNDVREFVKDGKPDPDNKTLKIVTNKELIAVDQDKLGIPCRRVWSNAFTDVLVKPLENGEAAVCLFNKSNEEKTISANIRAVACRSFTDLPIANNYECRELWDDSIKEINEILSASVPSHGVKVYRVKGI